MRSRILSLNFLSFLNVKTCKSVKSSKFDEMARNDDLTELISEMLIKQDRTNEILEDFMAGSIKQFEQQLKFNERFLDKLERFETFT